MQSSFEMTVVVLSGVALLGFCVRRNVALPS
jgi:hypothetical protein